MFNHFNSTAELVFQEYVKRWKFKKNVEDVSFEFESNASSYTFDVSRKVKRLTSYSFIDRDDNPTSAYKNKGEFQVDTEAVFPPVKFNKSGLKPDVPDFVYSDTPMSGSVTLKVRVKLDLNHRMIWRARGWE